MAALMVKRLKRAPLSALILLIFAGVLAAALCGLGAANRAEAENYEEAFRTIPVTLTVSSLNGTETDDLYIESFEVNAFRTTYVLGDYLKDVQIKITAAIGEASIGGEQISSTKLVGITSFRADNNLAQSAENIVSWLEGYDESILATKELVCLLPEKMMPESNGTPVKVSVSCIDKYIEHGRTVEFSYDFTLTVAGTHSMQTNNIYCPYSVVDMVYGKLNNPDKMFKSLSATVIDNSMLDEVREKAAEWFAEPNPAGKQTPWDYSWYSYYPHALVIDDSQPVAAAAAMEDSIRVNRLCTKLVYAVTAAASFLIGFLMIRQRKREIALMRTMGTPEVKIYLGLALEQMLCVILGAAIGGAAFLWNPAGQLGLFLAVYFLGLCLSLLIFLTRNLLATIKEEE